MQMKSSTNKLNAQDAIEKKSQSDPGINLYEFPEDIPVHDSFSNISKIPDDEKRNMLSVGVDTSEKERSGTFIQMDNSIIYSESKHEVLRFYRSGIHLKSEVMGM